MTVPARAPFGAAWAALRDLPGGPAPDAGLINHTWLMGEPPRFVAQRVNAIFAPSVHDDIEAVTAHLARHGLPTPRLVRTDDGALWAHDEEGAVWRVFDFIPGRTIHRVGTPEVAFAAGGLVARFHAALDDLDWTWRHVRPGAHDTALHLSRLEPHAADPLAAAILDAWRDWPGPLDLPTRPCHGDLKISNVRFAEDGTALCLLDLDTLSALSLDVELGDAWRSWCNPVGEDAVETRLDLDVLAAAWAGYASGRPVDRGTREALVFAAERIALELASRFCLDVFQDRYFGWNAVRFPSRAAHNRFRAQGQLALALDARGKRREIGRILR
jgi:Ser/Thr protein kinase RdoA (MazF antagonist)